MKIIRSFLVLLSAFIGCQEQAANTGDVAMDFIIDTLNGLINDKWVDDKQKQKYMPLARLSSDSCKETLSRAFEKLIYLVSAEELNVSSPLERDAIRLCEVLAILARRS